MFFKHLKGNYRTIVYDNTRVAVARFVGHTIKEPTEAFSRDSTYSSLNEANAYLDEVLEKLNSRTLSNSNKSPLELLNEEREYLFPDMPLYETASIADLRVNKYSTIMVDSCYYSVPDSYVGTMVRCKVYTTKILVFYDEKEIARHDKVHGSNLWRIDIAHYTRTLFRKPKALVNSTAFKQMDNELKTVYSKYFKGNDKDFVRLIELVGKFGLVAINNAINNLQEVCPTDISIDKIEFLCTRNDDPKVIYMEDHNDEIKSNSLNLLDEFNNLLNS
ncbi:Mu transposase domain-containing protein [Clostridium oryzae]|uniref:Transposase for insertion sequence element IS21-like C-terminal domain-containing protein n=1 Tax=Clostridium oryzae TaxID=1450648 RepID=A0A1V4IKY5_9CLOT|nr:hypothetical protein [Clostridium oryzae]OPJ60563.1 hypothetical protein CLORY_27390 [Clostridium oryzae]